MMPAVISRTVYEGSILAARSKKLTNAVVDVPDKDMYCLVEDEAKVY